MDTIDRNPDCMSLPIVEATSSGSQNPSLKTKFAWTNILFVLASVVCLLLLVAISAERYNPFRNQHAHFGPRPFSRFQGIRHQSPYSSHVDIKRPLYTVRIPPLDVNITTFQDCLVFAATLCTMYPFEGCEYCKNWTSSYGPDPVHAEYYLENLCALAFQSSICAHFPDVGACNTCHLMFPGGTPYLVNYK